MKNIFLLFFALCPFVLAAQDNLGQAAVDSMVKQLDKTANDTAKITLLNDISYEVNPIDAVQAQRYSEQALSLAGRIKWRNGQGESLGTLASAYQTQANYPKSLDCYLRALSIFESLGLKSRAGRMQGNIGTLYYSLKKYPKALDYYLKALSIAQELNDTLGQSASMGNVGSAYRLMGNYDKALEYLHQALKVNGTITYKRGMTINLANISLVYSARKDYSRALHYSFRSLAIAKETDNKQTMAMNYENIGSAYYLMAKDSVIKTAPDSLVAGTRKENIRRSLYYLGQAMALVRELQDLNDLGEISHDLAEANEIAGNYKDALRYYKDFTMFKDSVFSTDKSLHISSRETQREEELKNKQIQINKQTLVQKRNERIIFGAGVALLVMVILGIFRNYRAQKLRNSLQAELLTQKEMLMKEIHHRVKNNLQVVGTLLDLQLMNVSDEHAKDAITESANRLKAMSLIHEQLYRDDHITTIECAQFTEDLHKQVSAVFKKPGQTITYENEGTNMILDVDTAVPLGLIINELMTNSYKYAFKQAIGTINLKIDRVGEYYRLMYQDSGAGLPAGMNVKTLKSLGMKIIQSLSKQLNGSFNYEPDTRHFVVTFKDLAGRKMVD